MDEALERWKRWTTNLSWRKIAWWPHIDLCRLGIDTINLLCAAGLPGAEKMDVGFCLRKIDEWAVKVKDYTARMMHVFERHPERFGDSIGYFKALCLITTLQRDCGVQYNPLKRNFDVPLEVADSFIFGIIQGNGGTCASLPVLYCAVGHRLQYPMYLLHTSADKVIHVFVRWDDGDVRFNIEATGQGMGAPTDEHYRTGQYLQTPQIEQAGCFLTPKNMRHCLASFLAERAVHCKNIGAFHEAIEAMCWAFASHPENLLYFEAAKGFYNQWRHQLEARKPADFPQIAVTSLERRFPQIVPLKFELDLCCLETMECLLNDTRHDRNLWEPLRRGQKPVAVVRQVESRVDKNGGKKIRFLPEKINGPNWGDFANV